MRSIVGIDEAGRGPLAGPVAVGLVRIREGYDLPAVFPGLNDSKKLTEKKREKLFELLEEQVRIGELQYTVVLRSAGDIDRYGIARVVREAIEKGLELLGAGEVEVKLDGSLAAPPEYVQETVIGGDALVPSIMLASVAAKVVRDRHMVELHDQFPLYGFSKHKGYGTKAHMEAIRTHGMCAVHRSSFIHLDR